MRTALPISLQIPPQIPTRVEAYSKKDLSCLQQMPFASQLDTVLAKPVQISRVQFLTYMQFRQRHSLTVEDLRASVESKEIQLRACLDVTNGNVHAKSTIDVQRTRPESEEIGEAFGLAVLDQLIGTNEMDWTHLPEQSSKTFDFVASDGLNCFESECKGCFVPTTAKKTDNVYSHKAGDHGIDKKLAALEKEYGTAFRIGTIAAISKDPIDFPKVWLVDPPVDDRDRDPADFKLLARLEFLAAWIGTTNPRHPLAVALQNRVTAARSVANISDLDRVSLVDGRGEPIDLSPYTPGGVHSRFFATKSVVTDGPTGGWVFPLEGDRLFFFGIMDDLLVLAAEQDFDRIRAYGREPGIVEKTVRCVFSTGRFKGYQLNSDSESVVSNTPGYIAVEARGEIHYSSGGLAFGWLERPSDL